MCICVGTAKGVWAHKCRFYIFIIRILIVIIHKMNLAETQI